MPHFSQRSLDRLRTCHPHLQALMHEAIQIMDFSVLEGHRGKADQDRAVAEGTSKTPWPKSKHNQIPSMAVDIAPYPIDWRDRERFCLLAGIVKGLAHASGIDIRWGGDRDSDENIREHSFQDLPHFELV